MVLTDQVRSADTRDETHQRVRRRTVLALGAAAAVTGVAGCDREPPAPPPPDPLLPLATDAVALAGRYRLAAADLPDRAPTLTPIAEAHEAHAAELARLMATPTPPAPSAAPSADGADARLEALRAAEKAAYDAAVEACVDAPAHRAALVGSIAAARATHLEALK